MKTIKFHKIHRQLRTKGAPERKLTWEAIEQIRSDIFYTQFKKRHVSVICTDQNRAFKVACECLFSILSFNQVSETGVSRGVDHTPAC